MWRGAWATALVLVAALAPLTSLPGPGAGAPSASGSTQSSTHAPLVDDPPGVLWLCPDPGGLAVASVAGAGAAFSPPPLLPQRPPPSILDPWQARPCATPYCTCTAGAVRCERLAVGAAARALATLRATGAPPARAEHAPTPGPALGPGRASGSGHSPGFGHAPGPGHSPGPRHSPGPGHAPDPGHAPRPAFRRAHRLRRPRLLSLRGSALRDLRPGAFDAHYFAKVRQLVLARTGLRRLRPGALRGLRSLRSLDLSGNALRAVPASALVSTPALASLDLSGNAVASLPDDAFTGVTLRRLRTLRLDGNALRVVATRALRSLPRLRELRLAGNRLARLPPLLLRPAHALVLLDLGDNEFASAAALPQVEHVLQLRLRDGRLAALPGRAFATASEPARTLSLSLSGHALARLHADAMEGLGALRVLDLSRNRLTALPTTLFRPCPVLTHLFLARNRLTRLDAFPHLSGLVFLDLSRNHVTELSEATLPGDEPAALVALHLEQNGLRRVTARALARLPALRVLFLAQNALRSLPPIALDHCPQLGTLDLTANRFTDARAARRLARVPHLVLAFNRLVTLPGPGPRRLHRLHTPFTEFSSASDSFLSSPDSLPTPRPLDTSPVSVPLSVTVNNVPTDIYSKSSDKYGFSTDFKPLDDPDLPDYPNPPDAFKNAEWLSTNADVHIAPSTFKTFGSSRVPDASDAFKTAHSFDTPDDSKSSVVSNFLRSPKTAYSSRTTESFKSVDLSKFSSLSETTDISQDLDDFLMNDGHKTSSFTIGSDISKLPYPDSDDSEPSKVPYALDNFHASKTTKDLQSLDLPDVFDASESFDTPATHATVDPISSVTPFTTEPMVEDSLVAPDVSGSADVTDSQEITDSSNNPSQDNTISTSEILDISVTFDGRTSSYATKTVNIFQSIKMCNATDVSGARVTLNVSDSLLLSNISASDVVNLTSKALSALNRSDVVNASFFFNKTASPSGDTGLFFTLNVSSGCVHVAGNQSDAPSYGNTSTPPTPLVSPPQSYPPGPVQSFDPVHAVPTPLHVPRTVAEVLGLPLKAKNSSAEEAVSVCAGNGAPAAGSAGLVLQLDYSSNGITRVAHDAFKGFCALRRLSLADNLLRRLPPAVLTQVPLLQDLDVSGNNVSRLEFLQEGGGALTVLDVSRNALRTLPRDTFALTRALQILDLSANSITALRPPVLAPLRDLEKFSLAHNLLRDLPSDVLNHSAVLETVDLSHNLLSNLSFLRSASLQLLDLSFNRIQTLEGGIFVRVPALKHLDLGDNEISFVDPMAFAGLRVLQYLNLAMNSISQLPDLLIKPMKSLKVLSISRNKLSTLTDLSFAVTSVSELMELDMSGNRLSTIHPHAFRYLSDLRMLNLSFNQIKQLDRNTFCGNVELTEFDLSENIPETTFRMEFATPMLARTTLMKILNSYFSGSHDATKE